MVGPFFGTKASFGKHKTMVTKDSIESAYCFFHQKWRVYAHSSNERQKDDIEYAISSYVEGMDKTLYSILSEGKEHYLMEHKTFKFDMPEAIEHLEAMLEK